jgi:hypothetical protein
MARQIEASQSWLEFLVYQLTQMDPQEVRSHKHLDIFNLQILIEIPYFFS